MNTKENKIVYSGFWRRVAAYFLDSVIGTLIMLPLFSVFFLLLKSEDMKETAVSFVFVFLLGIFIIATLYFPIQHSSKHKATFGMRIMRLKIYDDSMRRIGFGRSLLRFLSFTIISWFYISLLSIPTIIYTKKKQALHDFVCSTVVVKEEEEEN